MGRTCIVVDICTIWFIVNNIGVCAKGIYSFRGVKVGLDCANGSSWNIAKSVFDALGADTYVINNKPNGTLTPLKE